MATSPKSTAAWKLCSALSGRSCVRMRISAEGDACAMIRSATATITGPAYDDSASMSPDAEQHRRGRQFWASAPQCTGLRRNSWRSGCVPRGPVARLRPLLRTAPGQRSDTSAFQSVSFSSRPLQRADACGHRAGRARHARGAEPRKDILRPRPPASTGVMIANSSPPMRATSASGGTDWRRVRAKTRSTSSPPSWPIVSLTRLKWSISASSRIWSPSRPIAWRRKARRLNRPVSGSVSASSRAAISCSRASSRSRLSRRMR